VLDNKVVAVLVALVEILLQRADNTVAAAEECTGVVVQFA
jgi:hypothetical protein